MTTASRVRGLRALWVAATTRSHHTTARRLARTHLPAATLRRAIHRPTVLAASAFRASAGTRAGGTDTARTSSTPSPPSHSFASTPPRMTASIDVLLARRASDHWRCHARRVSASTTLHPRHPRRPSLVRSLWSCCIGVDPCLVVDGSRICLGLGIGWAAPPAISPEEWNIIILSVPAFLTIVLGTACGCVLCGRRRELRQLEAAMVKVRPRLRGSADHVAAWFTSRVVLVCVGMCQMMLADSAAQSGKAKPTSGPQDAPSVDAPLLPSNPRSSTRSLWLHSNRGVLLCWPHRVPRCCVCRYERWR